MTFFALAVLCSLLTSSHPFRLANLRTRRQSPPRHSGHVHISFLARNVLWHAEHALDAVQSWRQTDAERGLVQNIESAGDWRLLLDNPACSTLVQRLDALNRSSTDNLLAFTVWIHTRKLFHLCVRDSSYTQKLTSSLSSFHQYPF